MSIWTDLLFLHGYLVRPVEDPPAASDTTPTRPAIEPREIRTLPSGRPSKPSAQVTALKPRRTVEQDARLLRELWGAYR